MTTPNERLVRMRKSFAKDRSVLTEDYKYFTTPDKAAKQLAKQPAQKHTKCRALVRPVLGRRVENNQQKEQIMARNTTYKNSSKAREVKSPAFIAWHVAEKSKDKSFWTRIGAAWDHEDGKGFTLKLELVRSVFRAKQPRREARERFSFLREERDE